MTLIKIYFSVMKVKKCKSCCTNINFLSQRIRQTFPSVRIFVWPSWSMHSFTSSKVSAFYKTVAMNFSSLRLFLRCEYFYDHLRFGFGSNTHHTVNVMEASLQCELVHASLGFCFAKTFDRLFKFLRLFPSMNSFVGPKVSYLAKTLATLLTFIRIFAECELFYDSQGLIGE